jgi:outer membrane lipoprotein-sorting protein
LIQGRFIAYLGESAGEVVDSAKVEGRRCWVADVNGLNPGQPTATYRVWVDADTGIILREERTDSEAVIELRDIELGYVIENAPPTS